MSLSDFELKNQYKSLYDNVVCDFYVPLLREGCNYKRAVGFFSSTALALIVPGLVDFVKNNGKINIIASPNLSNDDIKAVEDGYQRRETVIMERLLSSLEEEQSKLNKNRLNLLANLIAGGVLHIKIATPKSLGIYHEKLGLIEDKDGNIVAFTGSMNETGAAMEHNYETIDVFCSWRMTDKERVDEKQQGFERMWQNEDPYLETVEFPQVNRAIIEKYKTTSYDEAIAIVEKEGNVSNQPKEIQNKFVMPNDIQLFDYQKEAISNWRDSKFSGIFDMATGTGKTYTALAGLSFLSKTLDYKLAVIIVVPYRHLVEQWVEDIKLFGVRPIIAYFYPGQNWRKEFKDALNAYNCGAIRQFCVITTNATFSGDDFQQLIKKFRKNYCFVVDEAHNFGAEKLATLLPKTARYRLALSATIERYRDPEGTKALQQYFGSKPCISFSLLEAINYGFLTPYYYHPVVVYLNDDEREKYEEISEKISNVIKYQDTLSNADEVLELLLIKRARIISGCVEKIDKLIEVMAPYNLDSNMLVYCGATKYDREEISDNEDIRQIDEVTKRLYTDLHMKVRKFTSGEDIAERTEIKEMFVNKEIQVITAIKCLDEGVNIPAIEKAFILASSTNPKEYIQRRGRVLRKHPGKQFAEIFDFITLPRRLEDVKYLSLDDKKRDMSLIDREFNRMIEFASAARNPSDIDSLQEKIHEAYTMKG
ncbi:DEAD/DEAH box helicase family protein [uncultured Anaerovibrio sp.]|uniref:DEAD/DEAH box helicase family protein n=1 Tax=uncultured Anaerovibrio sp. TaxID=361586 RepID=UPI002622C36B|nr:DEAD/DEAH box helicase family protein [uncultured Anaerovibrio sp.]